MSVSTVLCGCDRCVLHDAHVVVEYYHRGGTFFMLVANYEKRVHEFWNFRPLPPEK